MTDSSSQSKPRRRFWQSIFPPQHDFFGLLRQQADRTLDSLEELLAWMRTDDPERGARVRQIEHECDDIRGQVEKELHQAFATPIDREDIFNVSRRLDEVVNYAKNTVREMEIFDVKADAGMIAMAEILVGGGRALRDAFHHLETDMAAAQEPAKAAKKSERNLEKAYRRAVADLMAGDDIKQILLKREVYRHLSNTADRIDEVADTLLHIVFKHT